MCPKGIIEPCKTFSGLGLCRPTGGKLIVVHTCSVFLYTTRRRHHLVRVIGHVTIGLGMGHFLLVFLWTQVSISNGFRYIPPQTSYAHIDAMLNSHCTCAISRDTYPLCEI